MRGGPNAFIGGDPHDGPMPLDYFVWAIKGPDRTFVFDTGFDAPMGEKRQRQFVRSPAVGLKAIGVEPGDVRDVILSHMHYDHCGNYDLFPHARYHLQDIEMAYATGRCMCHAGLRAPFEEDDVVAMVRKLFAGRVVFHDGVDELAPGLTVHHVGGHSKGLQVVRVWTRRGWMVLASDASHFYANMEKAARFRSCTATRIRWRATRRCAGWRVRRTRSFRGMIRWCCSVIRRRNRGSEGGSRGWTSSRSDPSSRYTIRVKRLAGAHPTTCKARCRSVRGSRPSPPR